MTDPDAPKPGRQVEIETLEQNEAAAMFAADIAGSKISARSDPAWPAATRLAPRLRSSAALPAAARS